MRTAMPLAIAIAWLAASGLAGAQTPTPSRAVVAQAAPLPGANSFTEGEAKSRIEKAGYTEVSGLKKDDQGIWRGSASKAGKPVKVSLDYKGNVGEN
jgi:hypothetical protein